MFRDNIFKEFGPWSLENRVLLLLVLLIFFLFLIQKIFTDFSDNSEKGRVWNCSFLSCGSQVTPHGYTKEDVLYHLKQSLFFLN